MISAKRPSRKKAAVCRATVVENSKPLCVTCSGQLRLGAGESRLLNQHRAVIGRIERTGQPAQAERDISRDHAQVARSAPAPLARLEQQFVRGRAQHLLAVRQPRQPPRRSAAAHWRAEQHDAPGRQRRAGRERAVRRGFALKDFQDERAAHAVTNQVQGVGARLRQEARQGAGVGHQIRRHGKIREEARLTAQLPRQPLPQPSRLPAVEP